LNLALFVLLSSRGTLFSTGRNPKMLNAVKLSLWSNMTKSQLYKTGLCLSYSAQSFDRQPNNEQTSDTDRSDTRKSNKTRNLQIKKDFRVDPDQRHGQFKSVERQKPFADDKMVSNRDGKLGYQRRQSDQKASFRKPFEERYQPNENRTRTVEVRGDQTEFERPNEFIRPYERRLSQGSERNSGDGFRKGSRADYESKRPFQDVRKQHDGEDAGFERRYTYSKFDNRRSAGDQIPQFFGTRDKFRGGFKPKYEHEEDDDDDELYDGEDVEINRSEDTRDIESFIKNKGVIDSSPFEDSVGRGAVEETEELPTIRLSDPLVERRPQAIVEEKREEIEDLSEESIEDVIKSLRPAYRPYAYNLAYFVNDSEILKKFIEMGINIKKWDVHRDICEFLLRSDFNKHIAPYLVFLHDNGIKADEYGPLIEYNPFIFKQKLEDLQVRLEYLRSKKFSNEEISLIIKTVPTMLNMNVEKVDSVLGWYQSQFKLSGSELRKLINDKPKLLAINLKVPGDLHFCLKEILQYDDDQIKQMVKSFPYLLIVSVKTLKNNFNYLNKVMKFTEADIANCPRLLNFSLQKLKSRYAYLVHLGLAQFDPAQPNFISGNDLIVPYDKVFCEKIAKTKFEDFENFLKTL
jgi:mTERF domain-containing protein